VHVVHSRSLELPYRVPPRTLLSDRVAQ